MMFALRGRIERPTAMASMSLVMELYALDWVYGEMKAASAITY